MQKPVNASEHCSPRILSVTILHCCRLHASPCDSMQPVYTTSYLLHISCTRCSIAVASPADLCNLYFRRVQARTSHALTYSYNLLTSQFVFTEFQWWLYLSQVKPQPHPIAYILYSISATVSYYPHITINLGKRRRKKGGYRALYSP